MPETIPLVGQYGTATLDEPTPLLRWLNGVLQQQWKIITWTHGMAQDFPRTEWRDVPSFTE